MNTVRHQCDRTIRGLNITRWRFNVALCLTVLLDMDAGSAAAWAVRGGSWLSRPLELHTANELLLKEALEEAVLAVTAAYTASWIDPHVAALGVTALRAATKACRDKRVRDWVGHRNAVDGAVVSSAAVVHRWNGYNAGDAPLGIAMAPIGVPGSEVTWRMWSYRWRRRCGVKMCALRTKEPVPLETKREKVGHFRKLLWPQNLGFGAPKAGQVLGQFSGTRVT